MENNYLINTVLNIFEKDITTEIYEEEIEWDSLNTISIMVLLSENFCINEKPENLEMLKKFKDLFEYFNTIAIKSINKL
ncbi:hypothetical protein [Fluviispira multicolorata]|uniref:Acyl carrier protein n=1 Tax=Fluviispira multicolorata TaxID=2654512 RepID=A0A833N4D9_9BACT|nr:hypothetical protein [Fluviispira multicolorata]KAB8030726.1 hypothetical protein GCL57_07060 [Fluviispira multicolorata]